MHPNTTFLHYYCTVKPFIFLTHILLLALWVISPNTLHAQFTPEPIPASPKTYTWRAAWITPAQGAGNINTWACFRKTFALDTLPPKATLYLAVDTKYWLYLNGKMILFEGGLKRGPNPADTYYDQLDLSPYLAKGKNMLAILVWYMGKEGFSHKTSPKLGLRAEIPELGLLSDSTWKSIIHPAYYTPGAPDPNYRLPESNIGFDATKDLGQWYEHAYDDTDWLDSKHTESVWGKLVPRPIPQWKDYGLKPLTRSKLLKGILYDTLIYALPYNAQITPKIQLKSRKSQTIHLLTDNYIVTPNFTPNPSVRAEYRTRRGKQEYESFGWMNGHELWVVAPKKAKIKKVWYRETGYNTSLIGGIDVGDSSLSSLWVKAQRTLYVNMRDNFFDCPDRERAQWWGDVVHEMQQAFYSTDKSSYLLCRKAILELFDWHKPDGTLYSPIPAGNWDKELPLQMLSVLSKFGLYTYFLHTADGTTLKHVYPIASNYINMWKIDSIGRVVHKQGGWDWYDWGENIDKELEETLWYYLALEGMIKIAPAAGGFSDVNKYIALKQKIQLQFDQNYWNGTAFRSKDYAGKTDDRAQALAILAGLCTPDKYPSMLEIFKTEFHASPYMEKYVLQSMFHMNYYPEALHRMKMRYAEMIQSPLSTLYELWSLKQDGTYNHAWAGGPLSLLSEYIGGVTVAEPVIMPYNIKPKLDVYPIINLTVPSFNDEVLRYHAQKTDSTVTMRLDAPSMCRVYIPKSWLKQVKFTINGEILYANGQKRESRLYNPGITDKSKPGFGPPPYFMVDTKDQLVVVIMRQGNYFIQAE